MYVHLGRLFEISLGLAVVFVILVPQAGLLLRFVGDVITLVLIRGRDLNATVNGDSINLTDRGLRRRRITWVREMDEDALQIAGKE